jgi:hypothetical protein
VLEDAPSTTPAMPDTALLTLIASLHMLTRQFIRRSPRTSGLPYISASATSQDIVIAGEGIITVGIFKEMVAGIMGTVTAAGSRLIANRNC